MSEINQVASSVVFEDVKAVVVETLGMEDRAVGFLPSTELLEGLHEFDSLAVVELIVALQRRFGIVIDDYEVNSDVFGTFGDLSAFIERKLS